MTERSSMQRLLAAAGWDSGSIRHKQLEDALVGAGLTLVEADRSAPVQCACGRPLECPECMSLRTEPQAAPGAPGYRSGLTYGDGYKRGLEDARGAPQGASEIERCQDCGQELPLRYPCYEQGCTVKCRF